MAEDEFDALYTSSAGHEGVDCYPHDLDKYAADYLKLIPELRSEWMRSMYYIDLVFLHNRYKRGDLDHLDCVAETWEQERMLLIDNLHYAINNEKYEKAQLINDYLEYIEELSGWKLRKNR
jgi:hypothetical protein